MRIVVNHLTHGEPGTICVAGIDPDTGLSVRPVLESPLPVEMLSLYGGPFDIGQIIELGETEFAGRVPEVEDRYFQADAARHVGDISASEMLTLLKHQAEEKLGAIFGPDIEPVGKTCAVRETNGLRSLGCFWAAKPRLFVEERIDRQRIRCEFTSGDYTFKVPVTDIRLYEKDLQTPAVPRVEEIAARLTAQATTPLAVGLSRPYRKSSDEPARHWLQVNNVFLLDNPCWRLSDSVVEASR